MLKEETKKIVFVTGTRADFGKLKPLINILENNPRFSVHIFATGMHMLEKYGSTVHEIFKQDYRNIYLYNNAAFADKMDISLANTIYGFTHYLEELKPDLVLIHGDRPEAMAGAVVGAFNNIRVGHIEGGELSGTIDGLVRHSISKLAHFHFVGNEDAQKRLVKMGEHPDSIFPIGSPEVDLMLSQDLPDLKIVKEYYDIPFEEYGIFIYHPVTTEIRQLPGKIKEVVGAILDSGLNYIVIAPNNDLGADIILAEYERFKENDNIKLYPSLRFEYFLTLMKYCGFIIGNSSSGVREAPVYGIPSINIGQRQQGRVKSRSIFDVEENKSGILNSIQTIKKEKPVFEPKKYFGGGDSARKFLAVLSAEKIWQLPLQKIFNG